MRVPRSPLCVAWFRRDDWDELVASYRALGEAIVENKPMTRKNRARVTEYLREAGWSKGPSGAAAA